VLITFCGTLLFSNALYAGTYKTLLWILLIIFFLMLCCVFILVASSWRSMPKFLAPIARRFRLTIKELAKNPWRVLLALCASIIIQMWFVLLSFVLAWKIGISLSFTGWLIIWPLSKLSAMLPISLGGLGVREAALAGLLRPFGVGVVGAVGLGLLWESLFFAVGGVGGVFYFISMNSRSQSNVIAAKSFFNDNEWRK
jgi:uncharacterized membrane protein YbhN (UPF0104 family)